MKQLEGTIGYVELIYAVSNKLPYAKVKNAAGNFVDAEPGVGHRGGREREVREGHRLPGLDHQRARRRDLPDRLLHLAPGPAGLEGRRPRRSWCGTSSTWMVTPEAQRWRPTAATPRCPAEVIALLKPRIAGLKANGKPIPAN